MKNLSIWLPPFAGDYSGVCSALFDFHCLIVLIDAACCTRNYVEYEEPRWTREKRTAFSAELRTVEAVIGDDSRIIRQITEVASTVKPEFIAVLGSPVPTIVGMDIEGMAMEIENISGIPCLGFNTTGFEYYDSGVSETLHKLIKKFGRSGKKIDKGINLLGITPFDFGAIESDKVLRAQFESIGYRVIFSGSMGTDLKQVINAPRAELNIVVSWSGLKAARAMAQKWDIPYITGFPMGADTAADVCRLTSVKDGAKTLSAAADGSGAPLLIVSEQVFGNSLRFFLRKKGCRKPIHVAGFFHQEKTILQQGDEFLPDEEHLVQLLKSSTYCGVIGDPLLEMLPAMNGIKLFPIPHLAVSGSLSWGKVPIFTSNEIEQLLKEVASH